jgi:hypothetical protein
MSMQRWLLALIAACAMLAAAASYSHAIVPPTTCGSVTVKAERYLIKADQLRCSTAKSHAQRYLATKIRPSGYTCRDYGAETKLKFRCSRGVKVFFAIRR